MIENKDIENLADLVRRLEEEGPDSAEFPETALAVMRILVDQLRAVEANLAMIDEQIEAWRQSSASAQALKSIPGIGI